MKIQPHKRTIRSLYSYDVGALPNQICAAVSSGSW